MSSVLDMGGHSLQDVKTCCETWVGVSVSGEQYTKGAPRRGRRRCVATGPSFQRQLPVFLYMVAFLPRDPLLRSVSHSRVGLADYSSP